MIEAVTPFPEVIETCGIGLIGVEEAAMLADTALNLCRVGLVVAPPDLSGAFSSNAASLLCVLLTGGYNGDPHLLSSCIILCTRQVGNHPGLDRTLRLLEMVDALDPNSPSLWQCCIKLLAKATGTPDDVRILALEYLLCGFKRILEHSPSHDLLKWSQFVKALVRLNKGVFRRHSVSEKSASLVVEILAHAGVSDEVREELLGLPVREISMDQERIQALRLEDLTVRLGNLRPDSGTLGYHLLKAKAAGDRFAELFSEERTRRAAALPLWSDREALKVPRPLNLLFLLDFVFNPGLRLDPGKAKRLIHLLTVIIFNASCIAEPTALRPLLRAVLWKSLRNVRGLELSQLQPLTRMILASHMNASSLKLRQKDLCAEAATILARLAEQIKGAEEHAEMLLYWPMAAWTNICRELPQPTACEDLRSTCVKMGFCKDRRLKGLLAESWRVSLRYCEALDLSAARDLLKEMPAEGALLLLSCIPFADTVRQTSPNWGSIMEEIVAASLPRDGLQLSSYHLKHIEIFLRHASDVSMFEKASLEHLQPFIVGFLKREASRDSGHFKPSEIEKSLMHAPVRLGEVCIQLPSLTAADPGLDIEDLLDRLERWLDLGSSVSHDVVQRLQQLVKRVS